MMRVRVFCAIVSLIMVFTLVPVVSYAADGSKVSVTVNMPAGVNVADGEYVEIGLYRAGEMNGTLKSKATSYLDYWVRVSSNTASCTFDGVEPGEYIIGVDSYCNSKDVLATMLYYNADGSPASSEYTATPFTVSSGSNISKTLTLQKATRSISGTLTFTSPLSEPLWVYVNASSLNYDDAYAHADFSVEKGASSVDFSIGVDADVYRLDFDFDSSSGYAHGYYLVNDTLSTDYNQMMYFNLMDSSVSGLRCNADLLLDGISSGSSEGKAVSVTITLPEVLTADKEFRVAARNENQGRSGRAEGVSGSRTFTRTFTLDPGSDWVFSYSDYYLSNSWSGDFPEEIYAADNGVTTVRANAKSFDLKETSSISIAWPEWYAISGTLNRSGSYPIAGYVIADFDGEKFADRVEFGKIDSSGAFKIYVPQTLKGKTFTLYTVPLNVSATAIVSDLKESVGSYTLDGNLAIGAVNLRSDFVTYSGTVSLPAGRTAPAGGIAVGIRTEGWDDLGAVIIPAGKNSANFMFQSSEVQTIYATLKSPLSGVYYKTRCKVQDSEILLTFPAAALISGNIFLPDSVDTASTIEVYAGGSAFSSSTYASIRKGQHSASYSLSVPLGEISLYADVDYDRSGELSEKSIYIDSNWMETNSYEKVTVSGDRSGVDFHMIANVSFIKGKIYIPQEVPTGSGLDLDLYAEAGDYGGRIASRNIRLQVNDESLKTDANGRYIEYLIGTETLSPDTDFVLKYTVDCEELDSHPFYIGAGGKLHEEKSNATRFTYDGANPCIANFTLLAWDDGEQYVLESAHGLKNDTATYTYTYPGECDSLTLTFSDRSNAFVTINGTTYATDAPVTIDGSTASIEVQFEGVDRYGFAVTKIEANGVTKEKSGVAAVYTRGGDKSQRIISDLKETQEVSATISTDGIETGKKLASHAALFDENGRFLGISKADAFEAEDSGNSGVTLNFDKVSADAAQVTVFVIDEEYRPMGECMTK